MKMILGDTPWNYSIARAEVTRLADNKEAYSNL